MALSLVLFEGATPEQSMPILATQDPTIIAVMRQLLFGRLREYSHSRTQHIHACPTTDDNDGEGESREQEVVSWAEE